MKLLPAILLVLSLISPLFGQQQTPAPAPNPAAFYSDVYSATVVIYRQMDNGGFNPVCTATSIAHVPDGYVFASASHCIDPGADYYVSEGGQPVVLYPVSIVQRGNLLKGFDYAMLLVPTDHKFPLIQLGQDPSSLLGEPVVSVSAPLGMGKQVLRGFISSPHVDRPIPVHDQSGKAMGNWSGGILIQMPGVNAASSGSAIICVQQQAICGIVVGVVSTPLGQETVALPISRLEAEIQKHQPKK
jgi:Trypsin-like peptidase domain